MVDPLLHWLSFSVEMIQDVLWMNEWIKLVTDISDWYENDDGDGDGDCKKYLRECVSLQLLTL